MPLKVSLRSEAGENSSEPCQIRRLERAPAQTDGSRVTRGSAEARTSSKALDQD